MQAVKRQAKVAASNALIATGPIFRAFFGASAHIPPTKIAIDARWANPHIA
jgi:hypothetical protein